VLAWINLNNGVQGPLKLDSAQELRDAMDRLADDARRAA
jgi:hypothetical protein